MFSKALFVDFNQADVPALVLDRLKQLVSAYEFVSSDELKNPGVLATADIIFCRIFTKIDKSTIDAAPNLKYIGVLATSFDKIDIEYTKQKGIVVCNLGGYSTEAVAEFVFAILFEHIRDLERAKQQARSGDYSFDKFMGGELKGKTLGVIGAGRIGSRVAEIGLGIGMKVIYFDRNDKPAINQLGAVRKELDEVLVQSDVISLNLALNDQTERIITRDKINLLKPGCILVNTAPSKLTDMEAIVDMAEKGEIVCILDHSDSMDAESAEALLKTPNVVVYPPIGFRTKEADVARWEAFISNVEQFAAGHPQNVVNLQ
ncbi:MAG: NAD(P)-dependent oxidoreductase [Patescibacteria group bacterium]|jgi:lactate dehydrogenase-like 2-hydroxyacid dehydrogenase